MTRSPRLAIAVLTSAAWLALGGGVALAQVPKPEPLTTPIDEKWRAPLSQFLEDVGVEAAASLVAGAKAASLGGQPEVIAFRLEDGSTCVNGMCLTVIGSIENGALASPAMFFAPKVVTRGDAPAPFLGASRSALITFSEKNDPRDGPAISVLRTQKGWIVVPH